MLQQISGQYDILKELTFGKKRTQYLETITERAALAEQQEREREEASRRQRAADAEFIDDDEPEAEDGEEEEEEYDEEEDDDNVERYLAFLSLLAKLAGGPKTQAPSGAKKDALVVRPDGFTFEQLQEFTEDGGQWNFNYFWYAYRIVYAFLQEYLRLKRAGRSTMQFRWKNAMPRHVADLGGIRSEGSSFLKTAALLFMKIVNPAPQGADDADTLTKGKTTSPYVGVVYRITEDGHFEEPSRERLLGKPGHASALTKTASDKQQTAGKVGAQAYKVWSVVQAGIKAWTKLFAHLHDGRLNLATVEEMEAYTAAHARGEADDEDAESEDDE